MMKPPTLRGRQPRRDYKPYDRWRGSPVERGYDRDWQKVRAQRLRHDPLCQRCQKEGLVTEATIVHHIIPIEVRPDLRLVYDNTESICARHHTLAHRDM